MTKSKIAVAFLALALSIGVATTGCTYSDSGFVQEDCTIRSSTDAGFGKLGCQFANIF